MLSGRSIAMLYAADERFARRYLPGGTFFEPVTLYVLAAI
jgi:hypothetical protein